MSDPRGIVAFWKQAGPMKWFRGGAAFDRECEAGYRDLHFAAKHPLSVYAEAARVAGHITVETHQLEDAAHRLAAQKTRG